MCVISSVRRISFVQHSLLRYIVAFLVAWRVGAPALNFYALWASRGIQTVTYGPLENSHNFRWTHTFAIDSCSLPKAVLKKRLWCERCCTNASVGFSSGFCKEIWRAKCVCDFFGGTQHFRPTFPPNMWTTKKYQGGIWAIEKSEFYFDRRVDIQR